MRINEVRALNQEQLQKELEAAYRELMNVRFRVATRQLVNVHAGRDVRRKIARIKTVMRERELAGG